jgi:hypothetical protein
MRWLSSHAAMASAASEVCLLSWCDADGVVAGYVLCMCEWQTCMTMQVCWCCNERLAVKTVYNIVSLLIKLTTCGLVAGKERSVGII